ncbi:MAG: tannase/feruloyl esterase family alpha/beta hydrolase [Novosphingobium sp.]|nr:tannase/feruloyl esterase family alpha/beta hydrolase [Novosphingobium sp.]
MILRSTTILAAAALLAGYAWHQPAASGPPAQSCAALAGLALSKGKIDSAVPVAAGAGVETDPGKPGIPAAAAFCRVKATISAGPGSSIKVEVWLPELAAWNGKLLGAGNGGFGANLSIPSLLMRGAVGRGYAAVGTDMGHYGASDVDGGWALNAPEKIKDYGWRANHLGAEAAKQIVAAYYPAPLTAAYFHGCSDGGRQALMEAQRFPEDYDAVIAGAPAIPWTRMATAFAEDYRAIQKPGADLPLDKLKLLQTASLAQYDAQDGVKDGVIENPRTCRFDPGVLQCKAGETGGQCLSPAQVATARHFYQGVRDAAGKPFYPGYAPGAEGEGSTWSLWLTGATPQHGKFSTQFFRNMVHNDAAWDFGSFDPARDYALARARVGGDLDADNPDLGAFFRRGGKLIMYHGWQDAAIPPGNSIAYFERVQRTRPAQAKASVRLFMVPGMSHCLMGPGPNVFDALGTLDAWRQGGPAPERMTATKTDNDLFGYLGFPARTLRTRPLCAWPRVARWTGKGSTDDAANFACVAPGK